MSLKIVVIEKDDEKMAFGAEEVKGTIYDYEYSSGDTLFGKKVADLKVGTYNKSGVLQD
jgi:hypothetical protein